MSIRSYLIAVIILFNLGCSESIIKSKTWLPPKDATGSNCVQKCFLQRTQCSKTNKQFSCDLKEIKQKSTPITEAKIQSDKLTSNEDHKNCKINPKCEQQYQKCYTQCGGQLIIHKELKTTW